MPLTTNPQTVSGQALLLSRAARSATQTSTSGSGRTSTTLETSGTTSGGSGPQISLTARIAANEEADNKLSTSNLETQVRGTFDAQYQTDGTTKTAKHNAPDVGELSGRALSVVALNKDGTFSAQESLTARTELVARQRTDMLGAIQSGAGGMKGIAAYTKTMISTYDTISPEEREARGWSASTISQATHTLDEINQLSNTQTSLFDKLG
jgi:hypothetical protein